MNRHAITIAALFSACVLLGGAALLPAGPPNDPSWAARPEATETLQVPLDPGADPSALSLSVDGTPPERVLRDALRRVNITPAQVRAWMQHNLAVVNVYRAKVKAPPLTFSPSLNAFAHAASVRLAQNHIPHDYYNHPPPGTAKPAAENQGYWKGNPIPGWPNAPNGNKAIDAVVKQWWSEGPSPTGVWTPAHGHYMNMTNASYKHLGVGLALDQAKGLLYITNDFNP
jgi:uncharacterized protein YkwD